MRLLLHSIAIVSALIAYSPTAIAQSIKQVEVVNLPDPQNVVGTIAVSNLPEVQAVEVLSKPTGIAPGEVRLISSQDGAVTVPVGKVWQIINVNGGAGTLSSGPPVKNFCGAICSGGSCGLSSCSYEGFLLELDSVPIGHVEGCAVCPGDSCSSGGIGSIDACPIDFDIPVDEMAVELRTPFWLPSGRSLKVNLTNTFVSILEFDAPGEP